MKWVDNHKGVFNVEVVAVSSLHTQVDVKSSHCNKIIFWQWNTVRVDAVKGVRIPCSEMTISFSVLSQHTCFSTFCCEYIWEVLLKNMSGLAFIHRRVNGHQCLQTSDCCVWYNSSNTANDVSLSLFSCSSLSPPPLLFLPVFSLCLSLILEKRWQSLCLIVSAFVLLIPTVLCWGGLCIFICAVNSNVILVHFCLVF